MIKKVIRRLGKVMLLSLFTIYHLPFTLNAAFHDPGWSARAEGMGGVFCSRGLDATSLFYNPAGIGKLAKPELSLMGFKPYMGLEGVNWNYYLASVVYPANKFSFGLAYTGYDAGGLYSENTALFSGTLKGEVFSVGTSVKLLSHEYVLPAELKPYFSKNSASAFTMDMGAIIRLTPSVNLGMSVINMLPADVGIKIKDTVPMMVRAGVSTGGYDSLLGVEFYFRDQDWGDKLSYHFGGEKWFMDHSVCARAGYNTANVNTGFSFVFGNFEIDYSFSLPLEVSDNSGSHRLQTVLRFPGHSAPAAERIAPAAVPVVEKTTPAMTPQRKKTLMGRYFNRATQLFKAGKYEEAVTQWEEVLKIEPGHKLSRAKIQSAKEKITAIQKKVLRPDEKKALMGKHFNKATQFYKQGRYFDAISEWEEVLKIDPGHALSRQKIKRTKEKLRK